MATDQGARAAAGGMGELTWDRDADGTHSVLPVGCAACALPRLGGVGNLSIPVRAASPWGSGARAAPSRPAAPVAVISPRRAPAAGVGEHLARATLSVRPPSWPGQERLGDMAGSLDTGTAQAAFCSIPCPTAAPGSAQSGLSPCRGLAAGANAMATPVSVCRTRLGSWSACASTTRPAPTASAASPSTRTGPGLVALLRLPMNASVSIARGCARAGSMVTVCGWP